MNAKRRVGPPGTRQIALVAAAVLVGALGVVGSRGGPSPAGSPIRRTEAVAPVDAPAPARPIEPARAAEPRVASSASPTAGLSPSGVPSPAGGPPSPVFDLATLAGRGAAQPTVDRDRFRTNDNFTADDLAHPERYFEAAEHMPELRRDEERHDVLEYFLAYRAQLERDLRAAGRNAGKRAEVLAVIARYDAAIARMRSALANP